MRDVEISYTKLIRLVAKRSVGISYNELKLLFVDEFFLLYDMVYAEIQNEIKDKDGNKQRY